MRVSRVVTAIESGGVFSVKPPSAVLVIQLCFCTVFIKKLLTATYILFYRSIKCVPLNGLLEEITSVIILWLLTVAILRCKRSKYDKVAWPW